MQVWEMKSIYYGQNLQTLIQNSNLLMIKLKNLITIVLLLSFAAVQSQTGQTITYREQHRPQIHFSPKEKWMNDPNGMVYFKGNYHLFFQYHPGSSVWGPMHWGHAISTDLTHWEEQPIALYPDSIGTIFSGSAIVDLENTSGFGKDGKVPLVAIFTQHDTIGAKAGTNNYQTQSIAYSIDDGRTWTKFANNPVIKNPGIEDFRDPKVLWYDEEKKWVMALATKDRITFYSSKNLKEWTRESEFGDTVGAHGGVWECPDLFSITHQGEKIWVLLVSINPGGPNQGSATQYFTGKFDGKNFTPFQTDTRWIDYGTDNYAGVTWSNTGSRKVFLGWMSNWQYATHVPTEKWRSAMTIPRDLGLEKVGEKYLVTSNPVPELKSITQKSVVIKKISSKIYDLTKKIGKISGPASLSISLNQISSFMITLSNDMGEKVMIGYDKDANQYYIDRTQSGKVSFERGFASKSTAPRLSDKNRMDLTLIIDDASVELFADSGLSVMTAIFFPNTSFTNLDLQSADKVKVTPIKYEKFKSIWK